MAQQDELSDGALRRLLENPDRLQSAVSNLSDGELVRLQALRNAPSGSPGPPGGTEGQAGDEETMYGGLLGLGHGIYRHTAKPFLEMGGQYLKDVLGEDPMDFSEGSYDPVGAGTRMLGGIALGLPGALAMGAADAGRGAGEGFGNMVAPDGPSTELGPRTLEAIEAGEVPDTRPDPGMSLAERMVHGASGAANLVALASPAGRGLSAGARVGRGIMGPLLGGEAENIAEGNVAEGIGGTIGLLGPMAAAHRAQNLTSQPVEMPSKPIRTPGGKQVDVRLTRSQQRSTLPARKVEDIARGVSPKRFIEVDELATGDLQRLGAEVAEEIGRVRPNTAGPRLHISIRRRRDEALRAEGVRMDAVERMIERRGVTTEAPRFTAIADDAAREQRAMTGVMERRGDRARIREYESAVPQSADDVIESLMDGIDPKYYEQIAAQLAGDPAFSAQPIPVNVAIRLARNMGEEVGRLPERGVGITGGRLKKMWGGLVDDINEALHEADPELAAKYNQTRSRMRTVYQTIKDEAVKELVAMKSHKAPEALMLADPAKMHTIRRATGERAFRDAAATSIQQQIDDALKPPVRYASGEIEHAGQYQANKLRAISDRLREGGRGAAMFGSEVADDLIGAIDEMADTASTLQSARAGGVMSIIAGTIVGGVLRGVASTAAFGATLGIMGAPTGLAAGTALSTAGLLAIMGRVLTSPRGATRNAMRGALRTAGKPAEYAVWLGRLQEAVQNDDYVMESVQDILAGGQPENPLTEGTVPADQLGGGTAGQPLTQGTIPPDQLEQR